MNGNYAIDFTDIPAGNITIRAYCTAQGIGSASIVNCTDDS